MVMVSKIYHGGRPALRPRPSVMQLPPCEAPVRRQWFHEKDGVPRCPRRGTVMLHKRLYCVQHARALQSKLLREPWPWPKAMPV